jgi:hypothetical protein
LPDRSRVAKNEILFREVNERIRELGDRFGLPVADTMDFLCECSRRSCAGSVALTLEEYEQVRSTDTHFFVLPGHVDPEIERVVRANDRFVVVEKIGEAGRAAADAA